MDKTIIAPPLPSAADSKSSNLELALFLWLLHFSLVAVEVFAYYPLLSVQKASSNQLWYNSNKRAVLNRIALPSVTPPAPLASLPALYLWNSQLSYPEAQSGSSLCTRLLNLSWLFSEWKFKYSYKGRVSSVSLMSTKTHSSCFPRNKGMFWALVTFPL